MQKSFIVYTIGIIATLVVLGGVFLFFSPFAAPGESNEAERFVVAQDIAQSAIIEKLEAEGFIKRGWAFSLIHTEEIEPGAYRLAPNMNAFTVSRVFKKRPYMKWVTIPEGYRKEQIAEVLAEQLWWDDAQVTAFMGDTEASSVLPEGIYFPDTYLIPLAESPATVAERLRARFNERFKPYADEALAQNIKWTTLINIASIVERESPTEDMPLIAGILWNRLLAEQRLQVDATLQYIKGKPGSWWPKVTPADKQLNSPFNTYANNGLPPHPIANPGINAIEAVLYPEETDCFFYLHADDGVTHCAETYEGHLENIEQYLK